MYESFYHLRTKPFSLLPDPEFLYLGPKHKMALNLLEDGLLNPAGFIIITGEPGTGKTTLLQRILDESKHEFTVGMIANTHDALGTLTPWILMAFGQKASGPDGRGLEPLESFQRFSEFLAGEEAHGRRVLLVVDEAQNLGPAMLEELRLLSNNNGRMQVIQIILTGQPALRSLLQRPDLTQFAQRVAVDYTLEPLSEEDTIAYMRHRIQVAGGAYPIFTEQACRLVFRLTGGTPRLINQVSDTALAYGFAEQHTWVTASLLTQAAQDRGKSGILPLAGKPEWFLRTAQQDVEEKKEIQAFDAKHDHKGAPAHQSAAQEAGGAAIAPAERYERGLALKKAGLYKPAIEQLQQATADPTLALKAYAQIGLCFKSAGRNEDAVTAFRKALKASTGSSKETVQILYVLGRTLESLGRMAETLEAYRWIRREDPGYRDVASRIEQLSSRRTTSTKKPAQGNSTWVGGVLKSWQDLLKNPK
jgi:type II secretory pathway predicted ATPase ExeA